jgi:tRNA (Thr-GGU) A37 N-methylase
MPIQPTAAAGVRGTIELDPAFTAGLLDLDGFSHLILLYHLHEVRAARLTVTEVRADRRFGRGLPGGDPDIGRGGGVRQMTR